VAAVWRTVVGRVYYVAQFTLYVTLTVIVTYQTTVAARHFNSYEKQTSHTK
jgi:hypothetical protein